LPEVRGVNLPANQQPGARRQVNTEKHVWLGEQPGHGVAFFDLLHALVLLGNLSADAASNGFELR
jgi:hypothetical protein